MSKFTEKITQILEKNGAKVEFETISLNDPKLEKAIQAELDKNQAMHERTLNKSDWNRCL